MSSSLEHTSTSRSSSIANPQSTSLRTASTNSHHQSVPIKVSLNDSFSIRSPATAAAAAIVASATTNQTSLTVNTNDFSRSSSQVQVAAAALPPKRHLFGFIATTNAANKLTSTNSNNTTESHLLAHPTTTQNRTHYLDESTLLEPIKKVNQNTFIHTFIISFLIFVKFFFAYSIYDI